MLLRSLDSFFQMVVSVFETTMIEIREVLGHFSWTGHFITI
jgi:hypothetical protein